jgi:hypothetical protein
MAKTVTGWEIGTGRIFYSDGSSSGGSSAPAPAPTYSPPPPAPAPTPTYSAPAPVTSEVRDPKTGMTLSEAQKAGATWSAPSGGGAVSTTTPTTTATTTPTREQQISSIQSGISDISAQLSILQQAKAAGMVITPQTTVTSAQQFLSQRQDPTQTPVTPQTQTTTADLSRFTGGTADTARDQISNYIAQLQQQQQQYMTTLQGMPSAAETFETYRTKLGLPEKEAQLTATNVQIQKTQAMIDSLEKNINERISGKIITDPLRQRQLAVEQRPLMEQMSGLSRQAGIEQTGLASTRDQLSQMLQLAGTDQERQAQIAGMPLQFGQQMLPTLTSLAQYRGPEEEYAEWLQKQKASAEIGQQYATPGTSIIESGGRQLLINTQTGETIKDLGSVPVGTPGTGDKPLSSTDSAVRSWILEKKRANPNIPYHDLWGQLSDDLKRQGLNPSNYDKIFWEMLHPEGLEGYKKYVSDKGTTNESLIE